MILPMTERLIEKNDLIIIYTYNANCEIRWLPFEQIYRKQRPTKIIFIGKVSTSTPEAI